MKEDMAPESALAYAKNLFGEIEPVILRPEMRIIPSPPAAIDLLRQIDSLRALLADERARADQLALELKKCRTPETPDE